MQKTVFLMICLALTAFPASAAPVYRDETPPEAPAGPKITPPPPGEHSVENLISVLNDNQREYYQQMFEYSMQNMKPGSKQDWKTGDTSGSFEVDKAFVHKNTICRYFRETVSKANFYTVSAEGTGCKRVGSDGWCKLRKDDVLTCAMEKQGGVVSGVVDRALENLNETNTAVDSAWYHFWNK